MSYKLIKILRFDNDLKKEITIYYDIPLSIYFGNIHQYCDTSMDMYGPNLMCDNPNDWWQTSSFINSVLLAT
jgi:hypothetical protein